MRACGAVAVSALLLLSTATLATPQPQQQGQPPNQGYDAPGGFQGGPGGANAPAQQGQQFPRSYGGGGGGAAAHAPQPNGQPPFGGPMGGLGGGPGPGAGGSGGSGGGPRLAGPYGGGMGDGMQGMPDLPLDLPLPPGMPEDFKPLPIDQIPEPPPMPQAGGGEAAVPGDLPAGMQNIKFKQRIDSLPFYELNGTSVTGEFIDFSIYQGKMVMIVNVATGCPTADENWEFLLTLWEDYHDLGLEILCFPSNEFGKEEPGSNEDIAAYVRDFALPFTFFEKTLINGGKSHDVFKWLRGQPGGRVVDWNFDGWFLVNFHGDLARRWSRHDSPADILEHVELWAGIMEHQVYSAAVKLAKKKKSEHKPIVKDEL